MIILNIVLLFLLSNRMVYSSSNIKQLKRQVRQLPTSKCVCGIENTNLKLSRIISGTEVKPELRFPWLVPLVFRNGSFFCAGTIINSRYILTSAHCFRYSKQQANGEFRYMISSDAIIVPERITSNMLVGIGVHNLQNDEQPTRMNLAESDKIQPDWQSIDYAIIHRFYENIETAIRHDIALIRLRKEIDFDRLRWLRPICLPDPDQFELEPFNKFQLEQYVQSNKFEQTNQTSINQQFVNGDQSSNNNGQNNQMINTINQINNLASNPFGTNSFQNNQLATNGTSVYSSGMFNLNDNIDLLFLNESANKFERINSKRLNIDKLLDKKRIRRDLNLDEEMEMKSSIYSVGWGSTERRVWKLNKAPLWMQLKMLTREKCIRKNGEKVKWNFICAEGLDKRQQTTVGDSGGPLFGQIARKFSGNKLLMKKPSNSINSSTSTTKSAIIKSTPSPTTRSTTSKPSTTGIKQIFTKRPINTTSKMTSTTSKPIIAIQAMTTTEKPVIRYITKPPLQFKFLSKRPQKHQQINDEMETLITKVKENANRHFYSAMIYEDLFKTLNLPHDDLSKLSKEEPKINDEDDKESRDLIENDDSEDNENSGNSSEKPLNIPKMVDLINDELDLSRNNYVQLGITSWSSYLNPEIGMYTDVRAYLDWIKRNTQDANYCITDPTKVNDDKIPLPTTKPDLPEPNRNLNCGAEKLDKITYPWLVSLYIDENNFLGNCVYFFSNFLICSDIYAEQTSYDINQLSNRFTVQFYYPTYRRFKVKNIINRLLASSAAMTRREYFVLQIDDPDNILHHNNLSNQKFNRASLDSQINKNNPHASCVSARDYPLNEEASNLITFYLYAPGETLIKTQLKLTNFKKCKQIAPSFVTRRFLCAQIGTSEEINISDHFTAKRQFYPSPNRLNALGSTTVNPTNTTLTTIASKLKNFFRLQSGLFHNQYSNLNSLMEYQKNAMNNFDLSKIEDEILSFDKVNKQNVTMLKKNRSLSDSTMPNKDLIDGQPAFHKIDEQYTLIGLVVKAPFPYTTIFKHNNLVLILDLKKFRFQITTKLIKSLRTANRL